MTILHIYQISNVSRLYMYLKFHTYFQNDVIDPRYATEYYADYKCKKT